MCAAMLEPKPSDPNGVSPLHLAAKNGHIDVIRYENPSVLSVCHSASYSFNVMLLFFCPLSLLKTTHLLNLAFMKMVLILQCVL